MRVGDDRVHGQGGECRQLLALHALRRGVEPRTPHVPFEPPVVRVAQRTPDNDTKDTTRRRTVRELKELIAALDRRVPQVERAGETSIARAAAELRAEAVKRIEALERDPAAKVSPNA